MVAILNITCKFYTKLNCTSLLSPVRMTELLATLSPNVSFIYLFIKVLQVIQSGGSINQVYCSNFEVLNNQKFYPSRCIMNVDFQGQLQGDSATWRCVGSMISDRFLISIWNLLFQPLYLTFINIIWMILILIIFLKKFFLVSSLYQTKVTLN